MGQARLHKLGKAQSAGKASAEAQQRLQVTALVRGIAALPQVTWLCSFSQEVRCRELRDLGPAQKVHCGMCDVSMCQ